MRPGVVAALALQTWRENVRARSLHAALVFAAAIIYLSLVLGSLVVDQELRVLADFGLSFIELMGLAMALYGAATGVLREMETKTIYLILARPVPRLAYLLGHYAGLVLSAAAAVLAMSAVHLSLLWLKGWDWQWGYALAVAGIVLKLAVATALACLLALATTSVLSALTMAGIVWTLGHFVPELAFLGRRVPGSWLALPLAGLMHLLPNLQLLNFRDRLDSSPAGAAGPALLLACCYAALYSGACLAAAHAFFRRKEF